MLPPREIGRYEIMRPLGRGGMGEVFLARDTTLERPVAIKLLDPTVDDDESRIRILREARTASSLNHPNICTVYEVGNDRGRPFIAMEYIEGCAVPDAGPLSVEDAVRYGVEAADALAHAHDRGVVHGDLKAANAMIAASGRLKIVDFGLAHRVERHGEVATTLKTGRAMVAGTPYAMAPEQVRGVMADELSDVWGLGVLLFEMLAGVKPFDATTLPELFSSILRDPPAPLPVHVPDIVGDVVQKCLSKEPQHRYQRAADVRLVLEVAASGFRRRDRTPSGTVVAVGDPIPPPPIVETPTSGGFVGRTSEFEQLAEIWARAQTGARQLVLLAGEPGIGKTRLALTFARGCAEAGATVLVGRSEEETLVPYQPFVEALSWYVRVCSDGELRASLAAAGGGAELGQLVPHLLRRRPDLPVPPAMNAESQRFRLFQGVTELVGAAAAARPVLLILDDLQWADKPTLLMLRHLIRAQPRAAVCVIGTYRESDLDRTHPFAEMLADLRREPVVTRLSLRGLDEVHVSELMVPVVGADATRLAPRVHEITDGNPFFVGEMLRHLKESGATARLRGTNAVSADELGLPEGVREVIGRRLSRVSEGCNRVLALAAVVGREFDLAVVEAVGDLPDDQLLDVLDEAISAQLVTEVPGRRGRFSFFHALIRETLYGELNSSRRARVHRRVAEAIERLAEGKPNPPLADLAYHYFQAAPAGHADKAIDYATRAGDRAADALAHEEASRFYDMALQTLEFSESPDLSARRTDLHMRRARAFGALALWALEKREVELALASLAPEQVERRAELVLMLAGTCFYLLDIPGVRRFAAEGLRTAEEVDRPDLAADALGWLARCQQADGDLNAAIETDRAAMTRGGGRRAVAVYHGPLTLYLAGRTAEAVEAGVRASEMARVSRDSEFIIYGQSHYALALAAIGRYADARRVFEETRQFGRKYGVLPPLARATAMEAGMLLALSDFDGAEALQSEAREMARSLAFAPTLVSAGIDLLLTLARRHEPGRAEQLLAETTASVVSTPGWHEWLWKLRLSEARAELALARGEFDLAISEATAAIDQSRARSRPKYEVLALVTRAVARDRSNRTPEAAIDLQSALTKARLTLDPALQLRVIAILLDIEGTDGLAAEAQLLRDRIRAALPDETMRQRFDTSDLGRSVR